MITTATLNTPAPGSLTWQCDPRYADGPDPSWRDWACWIPGRGRLTHYAPASTGELQQVVDR